ALHDDLPCQPALAQAALKLGKVLGPIGPGQPEAPDCNRQIDARLPRGLAHGLLDGVHRLLERHIVLVAGASPPGADDALILACDEADRLGLAAVDAEQEIA